MFPSDCRICQASLFTLSRLPVCPSCVESIQPIQFARCNVCGDRLPPADAAFGDARCRDCAADSPVFERAVSYGAYTGVLRQLIHLLKYDRIRAAAQPLARLTAAACLQLEGDIDVEELLMIPVPVHKLRMRSRGFNQAELIARAAQRGIQDATGRRLTLDLTALLRVRFADPRWDSPSTSAASRSAEPSRSSPASASRAAKFCCSTTCSPPAPPPPSVPANSSRRAPRGSGWQPRPGPWVRS